MSKTALITGITGQDSAYLSQLLLEKGYRVVGGRRRSASGTLWRLDELGITDHIEYVPLDMVELPQMLRVLEQVKPDEIYNLAAQSYVPESFDQPLVTFDVDAVGPLRLLEAVRTVCPTSRLYQASSSEIFGGTEGDQLLDEESPMHPRSPYALAKLSAYWAVRQYREAHRLFACNGILFNHESPLRAPEFVTRKITIGMARIASGDSSHVIQLGNLDARRDWGHAKDYVRAMWLMLQQEKADDYVVATGESYSVLEFVLAAAVEAGCPPDTFMRTENSIRAGNRVLVQQDPLLYRPNEVNALLGNASKARRILGWCPRVPFRKLVREMVSGDIRRYAAEKWKHWSHSTLRDAAVRLKTSTKQPRVAKRRKSVRHRTEKGR